MCVFALMYPCMHGVFILMHECMHVCICMFLLMHAYMYICIGACTCVSACVCTFVSALEAINDYSHDMKLCCQITKFYNSESRYMSHQPSIILIRTVDSYIAMASVTKHAIGCMPVNLCQKRQR